MKTLLTAAQLQSTVEKLAREIHDRNTDTSNTVFVGIQQGGVVVADGITGALKDMFPALPVLYGQLDITFYRDDIRNAILAPDKMNLPFAIENKTVILIDDVLFTGRTIKAALDALLDYGRPAKVELCVLVDRKEHRQFPIQADYVGMTVETSKTDKVKLVDKQVVLITP